MISLDKARYLAHGNPIRLAGLLKSLTPSTSCYTAVLEPPDSSQDYYSQVLHQPGDRSARFSFFTPDIDQRNDDLFSLVDFLCFQAGEMGAYNVLAEIEESHPLFEILRRAGFSVFSWESIWRLPEQTTALDQDPAWVLPSASDENSVRCLYQTLVPPLVQHAEPFNNGSVPRLVYKQNGDTLAYVESMIGTAGTYLVPLIHPSVQDVQGLLRSLFRQFQSKGKPVYLQVRSYQAWLADALEQVQAVPSPRFALMVRHLAVGQRSPIAEMSRARAEQRQAEPTAPIMNNCLDNSSGAEGLQ